MVTGHRTYRQVDDQRRKRNTRTDKQKFIFCLILFVWTLLCFDSFGQIKPPQTPQFPNSPTQPSRQTFQQPTTPQTPMGATANDIMEQTYRNTERQMGTYINRPYLTPEQNKKAAQEYQMRKIQEQSGYGNPTAQNNFNQMTPQMKAEKEMVELLKETQYLNAVTSEKEYYNSAYYKNDLPNYIKAKDLIKEMLNGKRSLSIKDAFYFSEAAYGSLHLTYEEYNKIILDNVNFIKQWLKENKYDLSNSEMLHFGIQKFMSDTLYITVNGKKQGHIPYYYDYIDARAKDDKQNYFVTKTLATGSGQCHTFPVTYLILAEQIGVKADLAYNPQHSFIRYANNQGTMVNYETTVDKSLPNAFYTETLPAMAVSQKNNLYVNNYNRQQVVAAVLFDLAYNFVEEHWLSDKTFIKECMSIALPYFSSNEYINLMHSNLKKVLYADAFNSKVQEKHIRDLSEIQKYPDLLEAYNNYYGYMEQVSKLGIQDFPESEYLKLLEYYDYKGKLQIAKKLNAKTKKSLFTN